jgi:site-specific DNA-cytosine methylase
LTWFDHPAEVLLYYLVHVAYSRCDQTLKAALTGPEIRLGRFLSTLAHVDRTYVDHLSELMNSFEYGNALGAVDNKVFLLAMSSRLLNLLGIKSLKCPQLSQSVNPWGHEIASLSTHLECPSLCTTGTSDDLTKRSERAWEAELIRLDEAANREGRGQHKVNAARVRSLVDFLKTPSGGQLRNIWVQWKAQRDSIRLSSSSRIYGHLKTFYSAGRQVNLLLGGPPCKGWSRIGRSAIQTLREQGVSAWSSCEYGDDRNALLYKYVLFLEALQPDAFIFENVSNFKSSLKTDNGVLDAPGLLSEAIESLSENELHYEVGARIVSMKRHAIPQDRDRFIMFGINRLRVGAVDIVRRFFDLPSYDRDVPVSVALSGLDRPSLFSQTREDGSGTNCLTKAYTLIDPRMPEPDLRFLRWIRQADPRTGRVAGEADAHVVRVARRDDAAFIEKLAPGQRWMDYKLRRSETLEQLRACLSKLSEYLAGNPVTKLPDRDFVEKLLAKCDAGLMLRLMLEDTEAWLDGEEQHLLMDCYLDRGYDSHGDWLERLSAEKPCKTIIAHIGKDTYGYIHPYENRAISIRETARIQSFPDWFAFGGIGIVEAYSMIGNAVPPLIADLFASQLESLHLEFGLFNQPQQSEPLLPKVRQPDQLPLIAADGFEAASADGT